MKKIKRRGLMLILSSPAGAGKTTLSNMLLKIDKHIHPSISYTTRPIRPGEEHGKHYFYTDEDTFLKMAENGEFLEHAKVFGNYYGTPKKIIESFPENHKITF